MAGRLAVNLDVGRSTARAIDRARRVEQMGFHSIWMSQLPTERDTATVLTAIAMATERIRLGTFVLPIYTRHPTAMAQMALTLDELSGGRFELGIGVSHRVTVESMWGLTLKEPALAMREYAGIVRSLIRDGSVSAEGTYFTTHSAYTAPRNGGLPIHISALSPMMLELAGEIADGVALWMCAPDYIRDEVVPRVAAGRARAGMTMAGFEIIAAVPVSLTTDRAAGLEVFRQTAARYAGLPFYRKALDRTFGAAMSDLPGDDVLDALAGIGDEAQVRDAVERYLAAGTTLPLVGPIGGHDGAATVEQTLEVLAG